MTRLRPIARLLVIARGPVGEFAMALAAMRRIRAAHSAAHITLLTTPPFETLARACPYLDMVDIGGEPEELGDWSELVGRLRAARYARVYDLDCSPWTSRLFPLLWPFPPKWSGTALGCALPHRAADRAAMHPLERHASQLRDAGAWPDAPTEPGAAPPPDASWITRRFRVAPQARANVLLIPGAVADPPETRWPVRAYGDLAQALRHQGYDIIILGGPGDASLAQAIQHRAQVRDLTGRTDFAQIAALAARAALAIGVDTGLTQLVAAAGAPILALLRAPPDPRRFGPRGHVAVLCAEPLDELPVDQVLRAAARLAPPLQKTM